MGCGDLKSLLGSFSFTSGNGPTQNVRYSVSPVAVRTWATCSPKRQSLATLIVALTAPALGSSFVTSNPGEKNKISFASARFPPWKVRTLVAPRCSPRGKMTPNDGEAAQVAAAPLSAIASPRERELINRSMCRIEFLRLAEQTGGESTHHSRGRHRPSATGRSDASPALAFTIRKGCCSGAITSKSVQAGKRHLL